MNQRAPERIIPRPSERVNVPRWDAQVPTIIEDPPPEVITTNRPISERRTEQGNWWYGVGWLTAVLAALAFGILGLTGSEDTTMGIAVLPVMAIVSFMAIRRFVAPHLGGQLAGFLFAGLGLRFVAAVPRLIGGADSPIYQREGERIARSLRTFDFAVETGRAVPGTGAVRYFSGVVNVLTGSNFISTYLVFVVIAFVGQVAFVFGVRAALNPRQFRILVALVSFSPTMLFWPSSIGKESLSLFGIGLGVYGASQLYERRWSGLGPVALGVFAVGMVRPHVALVLLSAVLIGLFARSSQSRSRLATHTLLLIVVMVGSMWMTAASANLFGLESLDGLADVSAALDFAQERTSQDQSAFVAARVESPVDYPFAVVTVLFRPFVWETTSPIALISAVEGAVLAGLVAFAVPGVIAAFGTVMQRGQLLLSVAFAGVFIFLFSAIGNFGILSRQRAQVIPFVLLLVAVGIGLERRGALPHRSRRVAGR